MKSTLLSGNKRKCLECGEIKYLQVHDGAVDE